jgi:predicted Holliday junction resolvase-like endonuclease
MGFKLSIVLSLALIALGGAFKLYYDKSEAEKEAMAVALQQAVDNQLLLENTIKDQNQQMEDQLSREKQSQVRITELSTANTEAMEEVTELRGKFARHDLNMLSMAKPKLLEKMVNRGTVRVFEELEALTQPDQFDEDADNDAADSS